MTYLYNATHSPFFQELARQAIRARTIVIYKSFTQEDLESLYDVYALAQKYNGYGERKKAGFAPFELSHIHPVRGESAVGLFRADNLIIAPRVMNRKHGSSHFTGGASIPRKELGTKHHVDRDSSEADVIARIIKLIGEPVVLAVVESRKIQPAKRHALVLWLREHLSRDNPEHEKHFQVLETATATVLASIKREVQGKEPVGGGWVPRFSEELPVLLAEWERVGLLYRPELLPAIERLRFIEANTGGRFYIEFDQHELQAIFDVLHGKPVSMLTPLVDAQQAKALSRDMVYRPTPELKALRQSVPTPRVIGSFAKELDGEVIDHIPRFTGKPAHVGDVPSWSL
ncbi:hypothetical protein [Pseudomonas tolaasii]|uniref:hypothetical protein n=1 Tax=Pseudomonas tolaasii TaxID=29442 RepID=UPI0003672F49|nr:hypothetical protein [Pseudomonas tolaasii]